MSLVLVLNTGSSSVKFALGHGETPLLRGQVSGLPGDAVLTINDGPRGRRTEAREDIGTAEEAVAVALDTCLSATEGRNPDAVGHRVVHGGSGFTGPAVITPAVREQIENLVPLAPLHQPSALAAIDAVARRLPGVRQVASFDTSFHRTQPAHAQVYALPDKFRRLGIERYGFHGLSYDHVAGKLQRLLTKHGTARVVAAHLGSGASLCAMDGGRSVATSMGFSALDGLPMATRCGQLDPGALLHLIRHEGVAPEDLEDALYTESGLKGLAGTGSGDIRTLIERKTEPSVALALAHFTYRVRLGIGEMAAALGGLDALVFTGGIGENATEIRAEIAQGLGFLGISIDPNANAGNAEVISTTTSACAVFVIKADEESILLRDARHILSAEA